MNRSDNGYTIVEAMIFLAVSGVLFVSAMAAVSGQQQKTQFYQSIRDLDSNIRDKINEVGSGTFGNSLNLKCRVNGPFAVII